MANVDWIYLAYNAAAFAVTYTFLVVIFGTGLTIYHWGFFLPKLNKRVNKGAVNNISSDEDTGGKLKRIARKYSNVLEKTQVETLEDSNLENTQDEIVPHKTTSGTVTAKGTKLKKKSSVNLTAKSDTNVVVSHLEREYLLQKTQADD